MVTTSGSSYFVSIRDDSDSDDDQYSPSYKPQESQIDSEFATSTYMLTSPTYRPSFNFSTYNDPTNYSHSPSPSPSPSPSHATTYNKQHEHDGFERQIGYGVDNMGNFTQVSRYSTPTHDQNPIINGEGSSVIHGGEQKADAVRDWCVYDMLAARKGIAKRKRARRTKVITQINVADDDQVDDAGYKAEKERLEKMEADNKAQIIATETKLESPRQKKELIGNLINWFEREAK